MILAATPPPPTTAPCDATCIFARMQRAVNALPEPQYIAFTFRNHSTALSGAPERDVSRALVRMADGDAVVVALYGWRGNRILPAAPRVIAGPKDMPVSNIVRFGDFPLADFGLRYVHPARPGFFEPDAQASSLPVIAVVSGVGTPPYRIVYRGIEKVGVAPAYHLSLFPLRGPEHNVLREIWIDTSSNLPVRYVAERTVIDPLSSFKYLITVDPELIDGRLVNVHAAGRGQNGWGEWKISDVSFPDSEPNWIFDRTQWAEHPGEQIQGLVPTEPI